MRHSHECLTTVVRYLCERLKTVRHWRQCLTTVVRYSCEPVTPVVRHSCGCLTSHDVRANFNQFYFSQFSIEMVLFMSHICRIVQIAETSLQCVCERLRRVGYGFATYAMTWRQFCHDFCCTKKYYMFKTLVTVRDKFAMHARTLRYHVNVSRQFPTVLRIDSKTHRKLVASQ